MGKRSELTYPSRGAVLRRVLLTAGAIAGAVVTATTLPVAAGVAASFVAVNFAGDLAFTSGMRSAGERADPAKAEAFRKLVLEQFEADGTKPPKKIWFFNPKPHSWAFGKRGRVPNAFAMRLGRLGKGLVAANQPLMEALTPAQTAAVIRHERTHYKKADSRSFIPFAVASLGLATAAVTTVLTGGAATVPFFALVAGTTTLQAGSAVLSRNRERRADQGAATNPQEAGHLRDASIKLSISGKRFQEEQKNKRFLRRLFRREKTDAFGVPLSQRKSDEQLLAEIMQPPTFWGRVRQTLTGTHPLWSERITTANQLASQPSLDNNSPSMVRQRRADLPGGMDQNADIIADAQRRTQSLGQSRETSPTNEAQPPDASQVISGSRQPAEPRIAREPALAGVGAETGVPSHPSGPPPDNSPVLSRGL